MVRVAGLNFTLGVMMAVPMLLLQARQQPGRFVAINLTRLVLQLGFNILFVVVLRWGPIGVLLSSTITYSALGLVLAKAGSNTRPTEFATKEGDDLQLTVQAKTKQPDLLAASPPTGFRACCA